jgi:peptide/nickel transport system permease protein
MRRVGAALLVGLALVALGAPVIAPNQPGQQFRGFALVPPMVPRIRDATGALGAPFVHVAVRDGDLSSAWREDRSRVVRLHWFSDGRLVRANGDQPLLLLGADSLGRDVFARLLHGARASLAVSAAAVAGALLLGAFVGLSAAALGGAIGEGLMRVSDAVFVLPALYVVLALRTSLPLVLEPLAVAVTLAAVLALIGWPSVARGVRAIALRELSEEYTLAARAAGASSWRIATRHVLPATWGFLGTQALWLLPGCMLAEATMSYVGLGFGDRTPSWGTMLQEAANLAVLSRAPWLLSPAVAMALTVLAVNLVLQDSDDGLVVRPPRRGR